MSSNTMQQIKLGQLVEECGLSVFRTEGPDPESLTIERSGSKVFCGNVDECLIFVQGVADGVRRSRERSRERQAEMRARIAAKRVSK